LAALVAATVVSSSGAAASATGPAARVRPNVRPAPRPVSVSDPRVRREAAWSVTMRPATAGRAPNDEVPPEAGPPDASPPDAGPPDASPPDASPAARPLAPVVTTHFDAIPQQADNSPADPTGAVGRTNVVTAVNTAVGVYAREGGEMLAPTGLQELVPGLLGLKYDPKVVFDQYTNAFVLTFLVRRPSTQESWIVVTTIPDATAADRSTWCGAQLKGDGVPRNGPQWADYPAVGYDVDGVTIATNAFNFGGHNAFRYAQIYSIPNAELFQTPCDPSDAVAFTAFAQKQTRDPNGSKAFTIQPAQTEGASNGDQYLLSFDPSGSDVVVWRLRETAHGPTLSRSAVAVGRARVAPYGTQAGGSFRDDDTWWDPGDLRLVNAFYDADLRRVYAAHVLFKDLEPDSFTGGYPESVIKWYEVHPKGRLRASRLTRSGIVGTPETDAGWPVVATDASGDLLITYNRASKPLGEYLSAWAAEVRPGTTAADPVLLSAGTARIEASPGVERWGDFNAINRDPVDGTFVAMVNQYAKSDGGGPTTLDWQQTFDLVSGA
jgi:hypothetical protein